MSSLDAVPHPCACTTVRKTSRTLARAYGAALRPSEINVTQFAVLRAVQRHDGEPLVKAADDLGMDRTSLYRALAPMRRNGWVTTNPGPDGRSLTADVTARGRCVLTTAGKCWAAVQSDLIERFGVERWAALVGELQRLAACADETGSSKGIAE